MSWTKAWPSQEIQFSRTKLQELRNLLDKLPSESNEVSVELSRFLVVRATGYVENTFEKCILHFAESHSRAEVAQFVENQLFKGRNVSSKVLVERMGWLSAAWGGDLDDFLSEDDGYRARELNFMVDRRNKIAHGRSESVNRTKALALADMALELGDWLLETIDPR